MSYGKRILVSIVACMAALFIASLTITVLLMARSDGTGFAFSIRGVRELLITSALLGFIVGSAWHFFRR